MQDNNVKRYFHWISTAWSIDDDGFGSVPTLRYAAFPLKSERRPQTTVEAIVHGESRSTR